MKKIITLISILIILIIVVVGIILFTYQNQESNFTYNFTSCEGIKADSIELMQVGNSLQFKQIFNTYCEAQKDIIIEYNLSDKNIEIKEMFNPASGVARCTCPLEIDGQINNLKNGKYNIRFIFDNRYTDQTEILEEKEFELK